MHKTLAQGFIFLVHHVHTSICTQQAADEQVAGNQQGALPVHSHVLH